MPSINKITQQNIATETPSQPYSQKLVEGNYKNHENETRFLKLLKTLKVDEFRSNTFNEIKAMSDIRRLSNF